MKYDSLLSQKVRGSDQTAESRLLQLGANAGRQYRTPNTSRSGGRFSKLRHQFHADGEFNPECKVCTAMADSDSPILPHESELHVPGGYV